MSVRRFPAVITLMLLSIAVMLPRAACADEPAPAMLAATAEFDPPSFVPGQVVGLYARLDAGAALWRAETVASDLRGTKDDGPRILSASLMERSGAPLLVVRFVAWRPGQGSIPSMSVGGLVTPPLKYSCSSALAEGGTEPPQAIGQLDPPGLFPRLYLIGGLALLSTVALVIGAAKLVPWLRRLKARKTFARVRREYDALLARLEGGRGSTAAWTELCAGLRLFLSRRTGLDWMAITSVEAAALPADCAPGQVQPAAAAILAMGDEARFAGRTGLDLNQALASARSIGERLDSALAPAPAGKDGP
jgi:hypothetical protein